jgi:succinate dehydrogenase / fumarate reductase flavoprotein subunit
VQEYAARSLEPFDRPGAENPYQIQRDLQDMMQDLVGIVRTEQEMLKALEQIALLKQRAQNTHVPGNREYNPGWHTALDLENLLTVSEAITKSALERKESRGAQFREDFQEKDPHFGKINVIVRKNSVSKMEVRTENIPEIPDELKQVIEENK